MHHMKAPLYVSFVIQEHTQIHQARRGAITVHLAHSHLLMLNMASWHAASALQVILDSVIRYVSRVYLEHTLISLVYQAALGVKQELSLLLLQQTLLIYVLDASLASLHLLRALRCVWHATQAHIQMCSVYLAA